MFKKTTSILFVFMLLSLLIACDNASNSQSNSNITKTLLQGKTMGTRYNIAIVHNKNKNIEEEKLQNDINALLKKLNQQVSTYISGSQVSQFNKTKETTWKKVDKEFFNIVMAAQEISNITEGSFDISISPLVNLWGFGHTAKNVLPDTSEIQTALAKVGYKQLELDPEQSSLRKLHADLQIDLSAIAKGFAVDQLSELLSKKEFSNHLVEIGGELRASGTSESGKKWRIAVEQPDLTSTIAKQGLEISNRAVATSGDYRNYFVEKGIRRSHIIDPKTGYPIKHNLASVTVLHDSTMLADAYATALLVMGEKIGKTFVEKNNLNVLMIIRNQDKFEFWSSGKIFH